MATKERHAPWVGQAPVWPGPAKDPAWAGIAPEPAQAGCAHEPARSSLAPEPAQAGRAQEPAVSERAAEPLQGARAREPAPCGRAAEPAQAGHGREQDRGSRAPGPALAGRARGPVWRALLEAQWRDRVQEVTELSLAYHEAASAAAPAGAAPAGGPAQRKVRRLLRRTVAARQALADTEEALGRLASGRYGLCEGCIGAIPARLLAAAPEARYCPRCRPRPLRAPAMAVRPALGGR
jgi:RNA polymerase-binding transcription factor DksA